MCLVRYADYYSSDIIFNNLLGLSSSVFVVRFKLLLSPHVRKFFSALLPLRFEWKSNSLTSSVFSKVVYIQSWKRFEFACVVFGSCNGSFGAPCGAVAANRRLNSPLPEQHRVVEFSGL